MTAATPSEPLWDLVEESLDESVFLWKRWEAELGSLTRNLDEVWSWTEDRLQGALDGVRAAGEAMTGFLQPAIAGEDLGRLTVAAHLLAARSSTAARAALAAALQEASGPRLWAMVRGIEAAELDGTFVPVTNALSSKGSEHSAALCRLKAFRRSAPAREVLAAFESNVPLSQVEALHAAGHGPEDSVGGRLVAAGLKSDDPLVHLAAVKCGVRRRITDAWDFAARLAHERNPQAGPYLSMLAMLGSESESPLIVNCLREPALQRQGLFALGYVGTLEAVEICLTGMKDPALARSAGEAYCAITGVELERDGLAASEPADAQSPPPFEADALDANLMPETHDLWPLPDVEAVRRHWASVRSGYSSGVRYLQGRAVSPSVLIDAIETGPMLRRPDFIFEAAVRTGGQYDVEPRAFAHVQRRMMAAGRNALLQRGPR